MAAEAAQALVKLPAKLEDGARVIRQGFLLPGILSRPQHSDQSRGRGDVHLPGHRVLEQAGVDLERRGQECLAGNEEHDELGRRAEQRPVRLCCQPVGMLLQVPRMGGEPGLAGPLIGCLGGLKIGGE